MLWASFNDFNFCNLANYISLAVLWFLLIKGQWLGVKRVANVKSTGVNKYCDGGCDNRHATCHRAFTWHTNKEKNTSKFLLFLKPLQLLLKFLFNCNNFGLELSSPLFFPLLSLFLQGSLKMMMMYLSPSPLTLLLKFIAGHWNIEDTRGIE